MNYWYKTTKAKISGAVLLMLAIVFLGLHFWLTSGIGRGVVETRLSAALGRPVSLDAEFSIDLFPLPGAAGSGLRMFSTDGRWVALDAGGYLAQLALGPLLKGQVQIVALSIEDASVDLAGMMEGPGGQENPGQPFASLPDIQRFNLSNVRLYFEGMNSEPFLQLNKLEVRDLSLGRPADFTGELVAQSNEEKLAEVIIEGVLTLEADGRVAVELSDLDVGSGDWSVEEIEGRIDLDLAESLLHGRMGWQANTYAVSIDTRVNWNPGFSDQQPGYAIENLFLAIHGQSIEGKGCVLEKSRYQLHLDLEAENLNLQDIRVAMDSWRRDFPDDPAVESSDLLQSTDDVEPDLDLPFDLAVRLGVEQAVLGEYLAEGINVQLGSEPACPDRL